MTTANARKPLQVWLLSDGQPGHYNLSRGIVAALERRRAVEVHEVPLQLRFGLARNLLRFTLNHRSMPPSSDWLKMFYRMPALPDAPCDLIVSAGGKTSFANAWLAKRMRVNNLFTGSLRRLSADLFKLVVTMEPLQPPVANNLVLDLPPSAIDVDELEQAAKPLLATPGMQEKPLWLMMLGGDGAGYRYQQHDWQRLGEIMNALADTYAIKWLLLSSRRTGSEAERCLQAVVREDNVAASCWYGSGQCGCISAYLGAAQKVFVSEDSMTMLTEAISSQRPVVSLRPQSVAATDRYTAMVERFRAHGWLSRYAIDALANDPSCIDQCPGLQASPLNALADQLQERLDLRGA